MKLYDLDPGLRWLFCPTHPDDELAFAAWIFRLTQTNHEVFISWTHSTPVREKEARAVAAVLGVPQERLFFHGAPDGQVLETIPNLLEPFRTMIDEVRPDRVVLGAFEQGHLDHDATNFIVNQCYQGIIFEAPFYHTYLTRMPVIGHFADPLGEETIDLSPEEQGMKLQLAQSYPSQNIWRNLVWHERRETAFGRPAMLKKVERLRLQTHRNFLEPNLPFKLAEKVKRSVKWKKWEIFIQKNYNQ